MMNATEPKPTGGDILSVIRTNYPRLSRAQRRIADFILRQPEDAMLRLFKGTDRGRGHYRGHRDEFHPPLGNRWLYRA